MALYPSQKVGGVQLLYEAVDPVADTGYTLHVPVGMYSKLYFQVLQQYKDGGVLKHNVVYGDSIVLKETLEEPSDSIQGNSHCYVLSKLGDVNFIITKSPFELGRIIATLEAPPSGWQIALRLYGII